MQLEDRSTFLGLDSNRLARWDLRDPHGVVQEMASPIVSYVGGKDYARGTKFNCMATSGNKKGRPLGLLSCRSGTGGSADNSRMGYVQFRCSAQ